MMTVRKLRPRKKLSKELEKWRGKLRNLTKQSEKALRDLIDYKQELAQQGELLQSVSDEAAAASTAAAASAAASGSRAARRGKKARSNF